MKKIFALLSLIILFLDAKAQLNLQWAKQIGSTGSDGAQSMVLDAAGNVVTTGYFSGTVDFDPGVGIFTLTANGTDDIFVSKLDANGNFLWAKQFVNPDFASSYDIAVDLSANIFITGIFTGTSDFDPGPYVNSLTASGSNDIFVCKLDLNGNYIWAKRMGGNSGDAAYAYSIATDAAGNVFTTGQVNSSGTVGIDLDPGPGVYAVGSSNGSYACKLDANGIFAWAAIFISTDNIISNTSGRGVAVDPSGNVLLTGAFSNTVDFDPGAATNNLISTTVGTSDSYVCKLSNSGNFLWAKPFGNTNPSGGSSIISDALGNVYANGSFTGLMDFDPGPATYTLNTPSSLDHIYYLKLDAQGNFLWAVSVGGVSNGTIAQPYSIAVDAANNLYSTGMINGTVDFDPGAGTYTMNPSSVGSYILKLDTTGAFVWAKQINALFFTFWVPGRSIAVDANSNLYLAGLFSTCDFDFNAPVYTLNSAGAQDMFAAKYCQVPDKPGAILGTSITCAGAPNSFSIEPVYGATSYSWSLPSGLSGTSITNSINTVAGASGGAINVTAINACGSSFVRTFSVVVTPSLNISVNSPSICVPGTAVLTASGAISYSWNTGETTNSIMASASVTTIYTVTGSVAGCANSTETTSIVLSPVSITVSASSSTVCSGDTVTLSAIGAPSYSWTNGALTSSIIITAAAISNYTVVGSNNACVDTKTIQLTINPSPFIAVNSATTCSGSSVAITPVASGVTVFTVTGGNFTVAPSANTSYSVTGTGTNGCAASNTAVATIYVNTTPTITVNSASLCSGAFAVITPTGAASYSISGGSFIVSPSVDATYSVTGTTNGCTSSSVVSTISVNPTPSITINSATICSGSSVVITPVSAQITVFTITGGSFTVSPSSTTSYSVTGTGTNGCVSNTAVALVSVNITPTLSVNSATICSGNSVVIAPTGAAAYSITGNTFTVTPNITTSYSVTGIGNNNCVASNTIISTISVNITPTLSVNGAIICSGNSVVITPTGAASYSITGNSYTVTPFTTTSYSVTGDSNGCAASNTAVATISVNTTPTISVNNASICTGQTIAIIPAGADIYTISGNSFTVSPSITTAYSVTGTGTNGCVCAFAVVSTVTVNSLPTITAATSAATVCVGETATLIADGAVTYSWSTSQAGEQIIVSPTVTLPTVYVVVGADINGCISTASVIQSADFCTALTSLTPTNYFVNIFPNPSNGSITTLFKFEGEKGITIYDDTGRIVESRVTESMCENFDFNYQAKGIYFIRISSEIVSGNFKIIMQ